MKYWAWLYVGLLTSSIAASWRSDLMSKRNIWRGVESQWSAIYKATQKVNQQPQQLIIYLVSRLTRKFAYTSILHQWELTLGNYVRVNLIMNQHGL